MPYNPIEDYAVIGDGLTAALVSREGSIDWACFPRFDAPSVFARILDHDSGGHFRVSPDGTFSTARRYLGDTNVLETRFTTATGEAELVDFMPMGGAGRPHTNEIVRRLRVLSGTVDVTLTLDPRFDYGRRAATWEQHAGQGVLASSGDETISLFTSVPCRIDGAAASAAFALAAGETTWMALEYRARPKLWHPPAPDRLAAALDETLDFWRHWISGCRDLGYPEAVRRSALVLKLLDYAPTGAIVAAPTTSLPEHIGGVRNWDYRYAWVRDTAFTVYAFSLLGQFDEGESFFEWLLGVVPGGPETLQIMYGIGGERDLTEYTLDHLEGYAGSRPVRIGNAAYSQVQHDAYGDLMDCAFLLHKAGKPLTPEVGRFLRATADYVTTLWQQPDSGIWEMRSPPQHFVASKAQCWVALSRASRMARAGALSGDTRAWDAAAEAIMREIGTKGVDPATGSFIQAYGVDEVDASLLQMQLRRVIRPHDARMLATVARIEKELDAASSDGANGLERGLIRRYRTSAVDDGLPPGEGVFLMCSFWLVDVYAESGRVDEARALFERLLAYGNDVGLYAEEFEPSEKRHLGNFPQAFTHVALVNAAAALEEASRA
ncbi:MAG TPA: glycoside hydrolase family 15 protein [Vicinamibacterales bacterium]|nr:glycoside hydrolase family 15 protein [Vicinamibacterales bacterium]